MMNVSKLPIFKLITGWMLVYLFIAVVETSSQNSTTNTTNFSKKDIISTNTTTPVPKASPTQPDSIKNNNFEINPTPEAQSENPYVNTPGRHL